MQAREVIEQLERQAVITLDGDDLSALLDNLTTIRADDTCVAGFIRILQFEGHYVVQEQTPEEEVLVRRLESRQVAERFVEHRLRTYERMWDGCGCKIDYHRQMEGG
jgi:hypothetical protein